MSRRAQGFYQPTHRTAHLYETPVPEQKISDQEINARTFLARFLEPETLQLTLQAQIIAYGNVIADMMRKGEMASLEEKLMLESPLASPAPAPALTTEPAPWEDSLDELPPVEDDRPEAKLSEDQRAAWEKLQVWVKNDEPYFILRGFAGTGKTYLMQMLTKIPDVTFLFTAPTNKATKVLGKAVGRPARTTYSMLGLKMVETDDTMTLDFSKDIPYIPRRAILAVDEASMVNRELDKFVEKAREHNMCKVLYIGDPAQLPPPKESTSRVWKRTEDPQCRAVLKKVMRFDNQLLALSVKIRDCLKNKTYRSPVEDDHDKNGGVYLLSSKQNFRRACLKDVESPKDFTNRKIIAWRNKTVEAYNAMVRDHFEFTDLFHEGEQLMLAEPVEYQGNIIASIDDEVTVVGVSESEVKYDDEIISTWRLQVTGDVTMTLNIARDEPAFQRLLGKLANEAKNARGLDRKMAWTAFWECKRLIQRVRYAYAITAHRAQGSTYENVFMDQVDILANSDKRTAFRCLYVAATRPTTRLFTY